jgi:hypothetical protein
MINAQIKLVTLVFDNEYGRYKILSRELDRFEAPSMNIETNLKIDAALEHLLSRQLDHGGLYHNFKLTDVVITDVLDVYYVVFVTHETTIKNGHLLDLKQTIPSLPKNAQKIISLL